MPITGPLLVTTVVFRVCDKSVGSDPGA
jgi:hypothetical protein